MTDTVRPQMLWESADPGTELQRRFGFGSAGAAADWVVRVLAEDYGLRVLSSDRLVISSHNLMFWVSTATAGRLMIKVCRLTVAHDWLSARGAMVRWLAERDLPVAAPLLTHSGDHQLLRDDRSIGVQPVLPGQLLDAGDRDHVRAAGSTLGILHGQLADWPEAELLDHVQPVAGGSELWGYREGHAETVPADLRDRLARRIVDLPELVRQPVHADFRGANLLYQDGTITGVVDFEEARIDAAVVDLAQAVCLLGTWYRNWQPLTAEAQTLFLDSYTERRPLSEAELAWLAPLVGWGMLGQGWWDQARRWLS